VTLGQTLNTENRERSIAIGDTDGMYSRVLARVDESVRSVFSTRDTSIVFLRQPRVVEVLYAGLRESPTLRFRALGNDEFPVDSFTKAAIDKHTLRMLVAPPIVNPLTGKTVTGDVTHPKGYARVLKTSGKYVTVWIDVERERIQEGDVVIALAEDKVATAVPSNSAWWGVLTTADDDQTIPRRADVKVDAPVSTKTQSATELPPSQSPLKTVTPPAPSINDDLIMPSPPKATITTASAAPPKPAITTPPTFVSQVPPLAANAAQVERVKNFLLMHHAKRSDGDFEGVATDYGAVVRFGKTDVSHDEMRQREVGMKPTYLKVIEKIDGPMQITALQNNRYHCEYDIRFEMVTASHSMPEGKGFLAIDVLLTSAGPKIVAKFMTVYSANSPKRK
jgi:hypothetical protein